MQKQSALNAKKEIACYLLLLTDFFLILELSFFIQCNQVYFSDFNAISKSINMPISILADISYFLLAQLSIHFGYTVLVFIISMRISNLFSLERSKQFILGFTVWTIGLVTILLANQYYFPNSRFAELMSTIVFHPIMTQLGLYLGLFFLAVCIVLSLIEIICFSFKKILYVFLIIIMGFLFTQFDGPIKIFEKGSAAKPNVIIIGVDSLRPDFLSYFGGGKTTESFDSFLNQAIVFGEALTPLARTFPSWSSILTGRYPKNLKLRTNLAVHSSKEFSRSLEILLKQNAYHTIYATDETRFSNIDQTIGFDDILSVPMGLNDFLLGTFNDFPMSNLLINTWIGAYLFPFNYANRAAFLTYQPQIFIQKIKKYLYKLDNKPLFLAIHLCLPHYPYLWADFTGQGLKSWERYEASIQKTDEQLRQLLQVLQDAKLLNHAVVVLLSDHGEAMRLNGDRITEEELYFANNQNIPQFYPSSLDHEKLNQSAGHGTDVLGLSQYHSLLAFRLFGLDQTDAKLVPGMVSLLDIKPTILGLLHISTIKDDGLSLAPIILGKQKNVPAHIVFLESDYTPQAIRTVFPETRQVLLEGMHLFQIDPHSKKLTVKPDMVEMIIKSKQFAEIKGEWMLALYPQDKSRYTPILINLKTGEWTNHLSSALAKHSEAQQMLKAIKSFFGKPLEGLLFKEIE